jgi:hypothetical protein
MLLRVPGLGVVSVDDRPELWARERERAAALGEHAAILIGASTVPMEVDNKASSRIFELVEADRSLNRPRKQRYTPLRTMRVGEPSFSADWGDGHSPMRNHIGAMSRR